MAGLTPEGQTLLVKEHNEMAELITNVLNQVVWWNSGSEDPSDARQDAYDAMCMIDQAFTTAGYDTQPDEDEEV